MNLTLEDLRKVKAEFNVPAPPPLIVAGREALAALLARYEVDPAEPVPSSLYGFDVVIDEEHPWRLEWI